MFNNNIYREKERRREKSFNYFLFPIISMDFFFVFKKFIIQTAEMLGKPQLFPDFLNFSLYKK